MLAGFTDIAGQRSTDGGRSWASGFSFGLPYNSTYQVIRHPADGTLYAATSSIHDLYQSTYLADSRIDGGEGAVLMSTDDGATWQMMHDFAHPVVWLAFDPSDPDVLLASVVHSTAGGIYRTSERGAGAAASWNRLAAPPRTHGHPLSIHVLGDGMLLTSFSGRRDESDAFTASSGVFSSTDGGATWAGVDSFPAVTADRVAASAGGGVAVTLSSSQTALAVSLDAGATWTTLAPPQAREFVDVARIEGDYLYALSSGDKRLYRYPIASLATATDAAPEAVGLALRVAPNPTHGAARLAVTLAEGEDVRVTLHDALGRTVVALERTFGAGPQTLDLDTSGLAPGVYVAHVTAGGVVGSVRFTVAR